MNWIFFKIGNKKQVKKKIAIILFVNIGFSQWGNFDISSYNYAPSDLKILIESIAFNLSQNPSFYHSTQERVNISFDLSQNTIFKSNEYRDRYSEFFPKFSSNIFVTKNLILMGSISQLYSKKDIIQLLSWGMIFTSEKDASFPLQTSVVFCNLSGPRDFSMGTVSIISATYLKFMNQKFQFGIGKEMYSAHFFTRDTELPKNLKGEINFLLLGLELGGNPFIITPHIRLRPNLIGFSLKLILPVN